MQNLKSTLDLSAPLSATERSTLRKALISAGHGTRGLDDDALIAAAQKLDPVPAPTRPREPREPKRAPKPAPTPKAPETGASEPATPVAPRPVDASDVGAAISAAIAAALASYQPAAPAIDEETIVRLIKAHATVTHDVTVTRPDASATTVEGAHESLPRVLATLNAGLYPFLSGPAGSGKSTLAEQCAEALGLAFRSTGAVHQKYELTGFVDAHGTYQPTELYETVKHGGVFLWDEIDASHPSALVAFNQLLANRKMAFPGVGMVECHPDAHFIAAANTHGTGATRTYVGRTALDGATLDRYVEIRIDYDAGLELRLTREAYASCGGEDQTVVDDWLHRVRALRATVESKGWPVVISPRASMAGAKLLALGQPVDWVAEATLLRHLSADQRKQARS